MVKASSLEKQLAAIIKEGIKNELPRSKTRNKRNGNGAPLSAWMNGASKKEESKIFSVCEGKARFPYKHIGYGARTLAERIAQRYKVTSIQHDLIFDYVLMFYRGDNRVKEWNDGHEELSEFSRNLSSKTKFILSDIFSKIKKPSYSIPFNVLIDARVTNLLLLIEMDEQLKLSKRRK